MAIGKSFNLKKQKMTKESIRILVFTQKLGKNFIFRHHIELRSSTYVPTEESFLILQDLHYRTKLLREEIYEAERGLEKSQNIWGETNSIVLILQGNDGLPYSITTLRTNSFLWKDLKKSLHLICLKVKASTCCLVSRHSVSVRQNSSSKPENPGSTRYSQMRTWE